MDFTVKKKAIVGGGVVATILAGYFYFQQEESPKESVNIFSEENTVQSTETPAEVEEEKPVIIMVDVKGAVQSPGVFIANEGDRVVDMITAAGNFTKEADKDRVNLAQVVADQMIIYVPKVGEEGSEISAQTSEVATTSSGPEDGKVNLNTATQAELETLPGIGPAKAIMILEYREQNGGFKALEDLKKISGIGDKTFEKLKDNLSL